MSPKRQNDRTKRNVKSRNKHNLLPQDLELRENVDLLLKLSTSVVSQNNMGKALENHKELSEVIEKIKNLELKRSNKGKIIENKSMYIRNSQEKLILFSNWLKDNGAVFEGCSVSEFPDYDLGLRANIDIPIGSLFIAVPRRLMLTVETAKKSLLRDLIEHDQILKNMPNVALAIYLLLEKYNENSFYKSYIDILPRSYSTILYFSVEELEELRGSPTLELALKQIKNISRQYSYFHTIFANGDDPLSKLLKPHFTFEEYCWAVSTVMTRQNTIPSEDGLSKVNALIPLWDLCNHTMGKISTDYNPELDRSECLALRNFKADEQVFIFYGPRTNAEFFIHNGFVPENNDYDYYILKLGISKSDPLQEKRLKLLQKLSLSNLEEFHLMKVVHILDDKLLAFVRILNMNEDQLDHWLNNDKAGDLRYIECALDVALEKKCWKYLQTRLKLLLAVYKTTLEEDRVLLQDSKLSQHVRLAVRMRASEKEIISETVQWLEQHYFQ